MGSPLFTQCFSTSLKSPSSSCSICSSHSPTASVAVRTIRPPPASSSSAEPNHYSAKKQTETARVFKRQAGWPESVKNDLTGHFHRFMASLVEMSNQVRKKIQDSSSPLVFGNKRPVVYCNVAREGRGSEPRRVGFGGGVLSCIDYSKVLSWIQVSLSAPLSLSGNHCRDSLLPWWPKHSRRIPTFPFPNLGYSSVELRLKARLSCTCRRR